MTSKEISIMIILPSLKPGGTERAAIEFANYLARTEREVSILLMYKTEVFYDVHPKVLVIEPSDGIRSKIGKLLYIFYIVWFIRKKIVELNPHAILSLGYITLTLLGSWGLPTKIITSGRSSPNRGKRFGSNALLNKLYYFSKKILRSRVNGVIAQTNIAAIKYNKSFPNIPVKVIPNFIRDINEYQLVRKNQIITVGRCVFEKAQHFLIEAFAIINAPDWKLVIVGDGPKKTELENLANSHGISDRIIFTGYQKDVDYFLAQSKIFALTSIIEGFPNALIEGMANGLAPVSFNCNAGPSDIIQDGVNGFLIEEGNIKGLANRIQELIDNPTRLNSIAEKASKVREDYEISNIGEKYYSFIMEVSGQ
jgi:GalNAc-alpha-(1->4)-GalNAc-alpha-(1->3)-diNAcBac-PP-undecaprenol alpha-1,4-N-acetyl-D-galactosaminyltransferase